MRRWTKIDIIWFNVKMTYTSPTYVMAKTPEERLPVKVEQPAQSRRQFLTDVSLGATGAALSSVFGNREVAAEDKDEAEGLQKIWTVENPRLIAKYKGKPVPDAIQPQAKVEPNQITLSNRGMVIANEPLPNGGTISGIWKWEHVDGDPNTSFADHLVIGLRTNAKRQDGDDHWPHELDESLEVKFMANVGTVIVRHYKGVGGARDLGEVIGDAKTDISMKEKEAIRWKVVDADGKIDIYVHDMNTPALTLTKEKDKLPDRPKDAAHHQVVIFNREPAGATNKSIMTGLEIVPTA